MNTSVARDDHDSTLPLPIEEGVKPFIRWAGSKRRLLSQIQPFVPATYRTYVEPFLGGGSLFLHLQPKTAVLSDACLPLIDTWRAVAKNPDRVHHEATKRPLEKDAYYDARRERGGGYLQRAGRFIYLNKGAFNGLYRVNLRGDFNVPWGAPKSSYVCDIDHLRRVSSLLNRPGVQLSCGDYLETLARAGKEDLVFLDPPYVTSHNNNGFIEYNEKLFSWSDQVKLAESSRAAVERGATVLVTNANHPDVLALYPTFEQHVLNRASTLAASSAKRGPTTEALLVGRRND